ncbi:MAG TPA: DUF2470 domain-containing protein [Marmoricola sp.]|jgi:hypothetical protein|nr:DUF2470 domain-containing protein [Marmoricola sp.]
MRFPRAATPTTPALKPAERARTVIASASTLRVAAGEISLDVHRHGVVPDGSILFQAPSDLPFEAGPATATVVDVATVPQPDRIRGTVTLVGLMHDVVEPLPAGMRMHLTGSQEPDDRTRLVRLVPDRIGLAWRCETVVGEPVDQMIAIEDYRTAFPDPLLGYEAAWLPHLQADHGDVLVEIARHELGWDHAPSDVRALGIDRYGVVLRVREPDGSRDLRIAFDRAVVCGCDVRDAFARLLDRAIPGAGPLC